MEAYISHGGLPPHYRCDEEVNWSYDHWLEEGEKHEVVGVVTLIYGIVCIALYIPCCMVLLQPDLRSLTAYKFLFLISLFQILSLIITCLFGGVFFILGAVYCNYPHLNYIVGCFTYIAWPGVCITCFVLSASRLVDLWSPSLHDTLFGGKCVIYSFVMIFIYVGLFFLYAHPTVFNSRQLAWIFDPMVYPNSGGNVLFYTAFFIVYNNEGVVGMLVLLTLLFLASLFYKSYRFKFQMSSSQKQLFIQSSFSSFSILIAGSIYDMFLFVEAGRWLNYLGLFVWQITSAGELVLFLCINKTIRNRVLCLVGLKKKQKVAPTVGSVSQQKTSGLNQ